MSPPFRSQWLRRGLISLLGASVLLTLGKQGRTSEVSLLALSRAHARGQQLTFSNGGFGVSNSRGSPRIPKCR